MKRRDALLALHAWPLAATGQQPTPPDGATALAAVPERIESQYRDVRSVVVRHQGRVLLEHHAADGTPDTRHDVQSVTKSVLALAVGAALGEGHLRSVEQPVAELLPAVRTIEAREPDAALTVRHLLTMTAGFRADERWPADLADDAAYIAGRPRVATPGTLFAYDNLGTNLLALALEAAVGERVSTYAARVLLQPMGITDTRWDASRRGHTLGFSGLRLRTREMAMLGQLTLQGGAWEGRRLVPEAYARQAVTAQNAGGGPVGLAYGYLWWVAPQGPEPRVFLASGWGGQLIWVHPGLQLVIAITSTVSADANRRGQSIGLVRNVLVPALRAAPGTPR